MDSTPLMPMSGEDERATRDDRSEASVRSVSPIESVHDTASERRIDEETNEEKVDPPPSALLGRSSWILVLVGAYSVLAIFAWTVLCVTTYRPITTPYYNRYYGHLYSGFDIQSLYEKNQKWLESARVIQSIVGVLTIPLTSAVCSKAAVVFTQQPSKRTNLSLRQMVVLSNRGWNDPAIYGRLFSGDLRRYGSSFLSLAILLNILGGIISPLESLFVKQSTTKTPTESRFIDGITDTMNLLSKSTGPEGDDFDNLVSILTRSAITSAFSTDLQNRLWSRDSDGCNVTSNDDSLVSPRCSFGGITLSNLSLLNDPFLAQLPPSINTGLIRQFLPRMNSSATRDAIAESDFPVECESLPGAFYVHYNHDGVFNSTNFAGSWSAIACMPSNQTHSPWQATRDRQDISEQLYLNISTNSTSSNLTAYTGLFRITLNTSMGYFELPNYYNDQQPGPLLDKSPWEGNCSVEAIKGATCGSYSDPQLPVSSGRYRRSINNGTAGMSNSSVILEATSKKGPLLTIAMALFGEGSFIANRFQNPEAYIYNYTNPNIWDEIDAGASEALFQQYCTEQEPMMGLLLGRSTEYTTDGGLYPGCVLGKTKQLDTLHRQIEQWLMEFATGFEQNKIVNAFEAAAFLANQAWLIQSPDSPSLYVSFDLGADTPIAVIARSGIVLISVLLGAYLAALAALAVYSNRRRVWTRELDAFAMMQIGAAMSERISFTYVKDPDKLRVLDEAPGWVGDATHGDGEVGELGLGSGTPLAKGRRFRKYEET